MTSELPRSASNDSLTEERLKVFSWYHGVLSRDEALVHLEGKSPGWFLVRKRKGMQGDYVLSVSEVQKVSHYIIQDMNGVYFKIGDQRFADIPSIIEFYKKYTLDTTHLIEAVDRLGCAPEQSVFANNQESIKAKAKFNFPGKDPEDLPFKKGDILTIIRKEEDQWWLARDNTGREGMVPVPYIEVVQSSSTPQYVPILAKGKKESFKMRNNNNYARPKDFVGPMTGGQAQVLANHTGPIFAQAVINREPNVYDEKLLGFKRGDIIEVLKANEDGSWEGKHTTTGKIGFFPFTHVKLMMDS